LEGLLKAIEKLTFDYICLGNGNDKSGKWLQQRLKAKYLFSEYGWLPWSECFYVDDRGTGPLSSLRYMALSEMSANDHYAEEVQYFKSKLRWGKLVPFKNFVYVPLQVDTPTSDGKPDFKFRFTGFKNNAEFLAEIAKIIPNDITILVKNHPSNKRPTNIPKGMIDISKMGLSKYELYQRMAAMVAINSTSVLEAMVFGRHVFAYGQDIFSGKVLAHESVRDKDEFANHLANNPPVDNQRRFVGCLFQRQFYRHRWRDEKYVRSHYWNKTLGN